MKLVKQISKAFEIIIEFCVFASRWTQAPIYMGLIIGSCLYVYKFLGELMALWLNVEAWTETEVMDKLFRILETAFTQMVASHRKQKISTRMAALSVGIKRVQEAKRIRGLFP